MNEKIRDWLKANIEDYKNDPDMKGTWLHYLIEDCIGELNMSYTSESYDLVKQELFKLTSE